MKKILAFCFFPSFVPPSNGGESRLFRFYTALSQYYSITLLTSSHLGVDEETICHGLNFIERRIPKDGYFAEQYALLEPDSGGGDLSAPALAACGKFPTRMHAAYLEEYSRSDIIIHDGPFTVEYDFLYGTDDKPRVYNSYNSEYGLYKQLHPSEKANSIHQLVRNAEHRMLTHADLVLYCSDADLSEFRDLVPDSSFDALYVPNGSFLLADNLKPAPGKSEQFRAVLMGSGHPPNMIAAEFVVRTLAPALPAIRFDIIGNCLPPGDYPDNVRRHGPVDEETKAEILQCADLALNPMEAGSGSNVKVLEYFAFGLPVLSTPFGMRGILAEAGAEYLAAPLNGFVQALKEILKDKDSLEAIASAGKKLLRERYTWDAIAAPVAHRLDEIAAAKNQKISENHVLVLNDYNSFSSVGGGATRTRGLYQAVSSWRPVVFISFSETQLIENSLYDENIRVITFPKTAGHVADSIRINSAHHVSADDIVAACHCNSNPWLKRAYKILRSNAVAIIVEHCYFVGLPLAFGDRFIYSSHNNETELKKRLLEWHPFKDELLPVVERIEQLAVEKSALTVAVSLEDAYSLTKSKRTAGPILIVRNGAIAPPAEYDIQLARAKLDEQVGKCSVVFLGSAHMPNVEAARFISEELAPKLPEIHFHLLGSVCGAVVKKPRNVVLWGVVDEITKSAVMQSCIVALNPMQSGSGSNVKLADYLGNGLFVVTTEFGQRGYPKSVNEHVSIASSENFAEAIQTALLDSQKFTEEARKRRRDLFNSELAMQSIAKGFVTILRSLESSKRKKVLYVAYRYTSPALGGAEANIERFVGALGSSGKFDVDVVAPEISNMRNHFRFSETYAFDHELGVPVDMPNVRFARFDADVPNARLIHEHLKLAWSVQPAYEHALSDSICDLYSETGLTWGWAHPDGDGGRWAFTECGIFLNDATQLDVEGYAVFPVVTTLYMGDAQAMASMKLDGRFSFSLHTGPGEIKFATSAPQHPADPRPLAIRISRITADGKNLDLSASTLVQKYLPSIPAERQFELIDQAAYVSRTGNGVRLTDGRGPWSKSLERFIREQVGNYDLVIANNSVFRPSVVAMAEAKKQGVPSIIIPHAHFDDDFYHFPDCLEAAQNATVVLAAPKAACEFLKKRSCNVRYLPAGCDAAEQFTAEDREEFKDLYPSNRPFVLILGRKAGAKGYRDIINAVEQLNREGVDLNVVMIGPDDDRLPIGNACVFYLGRQPRSVVRGALSSCLALCNMSTSESFGIVLLEAWLAGKPVIANKNCVAFHDMAVDGENALLVDRNGVKDAIIKLYGDPALARGLAKSGMRLTQNFDWSQVNSQFLQICEETISGSRGAGS